MSSTGITNRLVSDFQASITGTIKTSGLTGTAKYGGICTAVVGLVLSRA